MEAARRISCYLGAWDARILARLRNFEEVTEPVPILGGTGALGEGLALAGASVVIGSRPQERGEEAAARIMEKAPEAWNRTQQYRRAFVRLPDRFQLAHLEHRLLLEAIERRDPEDAAAISRMHIRKTRFNLDQHLELFESE